MSAPNPVTVQCVCISACPIYLQLYALHNKYLHPISAPLKINISYHPLPPIGMCTVPK